MEASVKKCCEFGFMRILIGIYEQQQQQQIYSSNFFCAILKMEFAGECDANKIKIKNWKKGIQDKQLT